jgi:hypothetical protein
LHDRLSDIARGCGLDCHRPLETSMSAKTTASSRGASERIELSDH